MNFFLFLFYYFICTFILLLIIFLIYKLFVRKKCFDFSQLAAKEIDNYFNAYDYPDSEKEHLNKMRY